MKVKIFFKSLILFLIGIFIFTILDVGGEVEQIGQVVQPILYAVILVISTQFKKFRKNILFFSFILFGTMIIFYLLKRVEISDWIARLGFGMLFITIFSYLPQLIKKGYVEKF